MLVHLPTLLSPSDTLVLPFHVQTRLDLDEQSPVAGTEEGFLEAGPCQRWRRPASGDYDRLKAAR